MIHRVPPTLSTVSRALLAVLLLAGAEASGQNCTFRSAGSPLGFPALDPSSAATVTAFMDIVVRCNPASLSPTWSFTGANGSAPLRMKHATQSAYIPYTISTTLLSSSGVNETWRITGTVLGSNYQNATVGSYTDILTATVTP